MLRLVRSWQSHLGDGGPQRSAAGWRDLVSPNGPGHTVSCEEEDMVMVHDVQHILHHIVALQLGTNLACVI